MDRSWSRTLSARWLSFMPDAPPASVPVDLPEAFVGDSEEVGHLVDHGVPDVVAEVVLVTADPLEVRAVQRDPVGQDAEVPAPAMRERHPLVQTEQPPPPRRDPVLHQDVHVLQTVVNPLREAVQGLGHQFLEPLRRRPDQRDIRSIPRTTRGRSTRSSTADRRRGTARRTRTVPPPRPRRPRRPGGTGGIGTRRGGPGPCRGPWRWRRARGTARSEWRRRRTGPSPGSRTATAGTRTGTATGSPPGGTPTA